VVVREINVVSWSDQSAGNSCRSAPLGTIFIQAVAVLARTDPKGAGLAEFGTIDDV
jgi:hypothetical protein